MKGCGELKIEEVPFCTVDWQAVEATEHAGIHGKAYWRTFEQGNIRVRMVEYTPGIWPIIGARRDMFFWFWKGN